MTKSSILRNLPKTAGAARNAAGTLLALMAALLLSGCEIIFTDGSNPGGRTPPGTNTIVTYRISYDGNDNTGGTVPSDPDYYLAGDEARILLPSGAFNKTGFFFGGWSPIQNDDSVVYAVNDSITVQGNITLYAFWIPDTVTDVFTVKYMTGTATGGSIPTDISKYTAGQSAHIAWNEGVLTRSNEVFAGWNTNQAGTGTSYKAGDTVTITGNLVLYPTWSGTRSFKAFDFVQETEYEFTATPLAVTRHSIVYADDSANIQTATAQAIATEYENNIYQKMRDTYGKPVDMDNNDALIILLFDIVDGATENSGYIAGYFNSGDMYDASTNPSSNEADMINMDVNPGVPNDANFNSTLAHELQHLINFSVTYLGKGIQSETWLNEGLSTAAEYVYSGTNVDSRAADYNASGDISIVYGNNFYVWNGYWENARGDQLSNYTTAYMFFQWLRIHASNDIGIYKEIIESPYGDYRAVTSAAVNRINSNFRNWPALLRTWYAANFCNDATGYYGYENQLGSLMKWVVQPSTEWIGQYLYPGEGIIAVNGLEQFTPASPGTNVVYSGITVNPTTNIDTASPYTGAYTLAVNGNTSITGAKEAGYFPVASVSSGARNLSAAIMTPAPGRPASERGRHAIDALVGAEGGLR